MACSARCTQYVGQLKNQLAILLKFVFYFIIFLQCASLILPLLVVSSSRCCAQQLRDLNLASFTDNLFFIMTDGKTKQNPGTEQRVGGNSVSPEGAGLDSVYGEEEGELNAISQTNNTAI